MVELSWKMDYIRASLRNSFKKALMSHINTHVTSSKMLFEVKNAYFHNPSQIQLCLIMLSKIYRADFELIVPVFHHILTFDEDLLENALYKGFIKESLMRHLSTHACGEISKAAL